MPIFDRRLGRCRYLAGDNVTAAGLFLAPVLFYFLDIPELKATNPEMKPQPAA
ncbi:MAG: glutathione binding-like protein [Pseudomonadota bacterium]